MLRLALLSAGLTACLFALGCSATQQSGPVIDIGPTGYHSLVNPQPNADEDFGFSDTDDKAASAAYNYYFADAVNQHSGGRWDVANNSGKKSWILSNVFYTDPKAWQMGGNYWNFENDSLTTHPGLVPANRHGVKVGFHARWRIAPGDGCSVQYSLDGGPFTEIAFFSGGQNPSFPGWDRYTLALPNCGPQDQQYRVRFQFNSDGALNDVGFGVDRFAIYQTRLTPPTIDPSKENQGEITVSITHNFDGEWPASYDIYRSDTGEFGNYVLVGNTPYAGQMFGTSWIDPTAEAFTEYWYKLKSTRFGWDDSDFSNADFGQYWID